MSNTSADPTFARAVLQSCHYGRAEVLARVRDLTDDEYHWEPVQGCWTIRPVEDRFVADFVPEADPPPFTTISWRLWHIAIDCFESYSSRAFGSRADNIPESNFVGTATEAIELLEKSTAHFLAAMETRLDAEEADIGDCLGPEFGPFAEASYVDLALHANRELVHHGAEIGVLRDLYRDR